MSEIKHFYVNYFVIARAFAGCDIFADTASPIMNTEGDNLQTKKQLAVNFSVILPIAKED